MTVINYFGSLNINYMVILNVLTATILLLTLLELRRQRITSYRPKPSFISKAIYLQLNSSDLPAIWRHSTNDYFDDNSISHDNYYELNCYNAGVGPAIDVKIEWLVPQKRIVQYFIDMSEEYSDFINYDYNSKKITIKTSKGSISFQLFQDDELLYRNIVSIAPYNIHELISVSLPKSYLLYLSICTYISFILEDKDEIGDNISPIELIIKYKDTGNKKYKEDKKIHFTFKKFNGEYLLEKKGVNKNVNYAIGDFKTI